MYVGSKQKRVVEATQVAELTTYQVLSELHGLEFQDYI